LRNIRTAYVSTHSRGKSQLETNAKSGTTGRLEYAYDDYAVALLARETQDEKLARDEENARQLHEWI